MHLLANKKLNHFISAINRPTPVFSPSPKMEYQKRIFSGVILLAQQIKHFVDLNNHSDSVNILVAGSDFMEDLGNGQGYFLLNKILGTDIQWNISFTGYETVETPTYSMDFSISNSAKDEKVVITKKKGTLGEHLDKNGYPDILVLNHPGFESFYEHWFNRDNGIVRCLENDVLVLGASYGIDEYQIDNFYLKAYGMKISEYHHNNLCLRSSEDDLSGVPTPVRKAIQSGMCDWGRTVWKIESEGCERNESLLDVIEDFDDVAMSIAEYLEITSQTSIPQEAAALYKRVEKGETIVRIYSQYSLNLNTYEIFDEETKRVMDENVEIDTSDFDINNLEDYFNLKMLMVTVYRDYIKEHLNNDDSDDMESLSNLSEEDISLFTSMLQGNGGKAITAEDIFNSIPGGDEMSKMLGFQEKREMSESDKEVLKLASDGNIEAILKLPVNTLKDYSDDHCRNLSILAAMTNSIELVKKAYELEISFDERDTDDFNFLDTAAEYGSIEVARYTLDNGITNDQLNSQNSRGFTPLHQAATRNRKDIYELYVEFGADKEVTNIVGMKPSDMNPTFG